MKNYFKRLFGLDKEHWYYVKYAYITKTGKAVYNFSAILGTKKQVTFTNFRNIRNRISPKVIKEFVQTYNNDRELSNGRLSIENISYIGHCREI